MASTIESHYEPKRRKLPWTVILLVFAALAVGLGLYVRLTLPALNPAYIGAWKGTAKTDTGYEFRPDGTYRSEIVQEWYGQQGPVRLVFEGTWKATNDALYLSVSSMRSKSKLKHPKEFEEERNRIVGSRLRLPVTWKSRDEWSSSGMTEGYVRKK